MTTKNKEVVYVGLSGGVDSSVTAMILKKKGYNVVGVFIDTWQPDFIRCTSGEDRRDAMKVCDVLDIPFKTFDAKEHYEKKVTEYMIEEYRAGRTPNPDVMCNRFVKFGLFYKWAIEEERADLIATGHYARIKNINKEGKEEYQLFKGIDDNKDQSYFLWAVDSEVFSKTLFPIGEMQKRDVRKEALSAGLPTATKKDSQGICFIGEVDLKHFLSQYIPPVKGDVVDERGNIIGFHDGSHFYTIGQRHGFTVEKKTPDSDPFYIIEKDAGSNTLKVSQNPQNHKSKEVIISDENWIPDNSIEELEGQDLSCMTRYRQTEVSCRVSLKKNGPVVSLKEPLHGLAVGQSLVIYDKERCIGGGIIDIIKYQ